ncbi:tyrosyl-DNA phosphodiesterase 2 isoform X2 [Ambystoma mexicanum]|uniref:tyrosyl-DNA phosphodiesterase 2 isoform X2 n=1 Tax=Ambystoma mexicanum TaxID=8296 RepID=UPI0037E9C8B6
MSGELLISEAGVSAAECTGKEEDAEISLARDRTQQCAEFSAITSCDLAVAQCYLAENDWHMERAIDSFFEPLVADELVPANPVISHQQDVAQQETARPSSSTAETCIDLTADTVAVVPTGNVVNGATQEDYNGLSVITWNIDGLDECNLQERARGVCSYLVLYSPDVVFLQEVIPPYLYYLEKRAVSYTIISGNEEGYFTAIMLKKSKVKLISHEVTPFPSSQMLRNLLTVHVNVSGNNLCLMTSHLESTKEHSNERLNQLKLVLKKIKEAPESSTVLFAGDTNLRDQEVAKIGGLPHDILDIWEFLGKPEHCRYTWDTKTNNNLKAPYTCRLRFDRILTRAANNGGQFIPQTLDLLGQEKLDCGRFPSDHWGLLCVFDVIL